MYQINQWVFQSKISFNPDPSKQVQEIIFSRKTKNISHPSLCFDNSIVLQSPHKKHIVIFLDAQLTFEGQLTVITTKINKTFRLLRKLQNILPRSRLMTIYRAFVSQNVLSRKDIQTFRPHLDYGDVIYDEAYNKTFHRKLESIQYNVCLALSGVIRGLSIERLYQELGLGFLQRRRWYSKLSNNKNEL